MNIQADEAHKPHKNDLRQWLQAFVSDPVRALSHIPTTIHYLLHDMALLDGTHVTDEGHAFMRGDA